MSIPTLQFYWLAGGFFLGMFFMYNLIPLRTNLQHGGHLNPRSDASTDNSILKFGNPGKKN
jgi:hypothetical protein